MSPSNPAHGLYNAGNGSDGMANLSASNARPNAPPWSAQMTTFPVDNGAGTGPTFPQYSASTAAILERLQGRTNGQSGSAAFEAKRAEILQSYVTSDKLATPPPNATNGRKARGGKVGTPGTLRGDVDASPAAASSARGSGRGRGRGRGGRGGRGRGGKRKRSDSDQDEDVSMEESTTNGLTNLAQDDDKSDISDSYTPLPTRTKSGRSVNKPVSFVPTLPEPSQGVKRKKSAKTMLAAKCKTCHRDVDPSNNRIVFCDACSTAYHQYCHSPPIDNEVVTVLEKEWLCGPCQRTKESVVGGTEELVAAEDLSIDEV